MIGADNLSLLYWQGISETRVDIVCDLYIVIHTWLTWMIPGKTTDTEWPVTDSN